MGNIRNLQAVVACTAACAEPLPRFVDIVRVPTVTAGEFRARMREIAFEVALDLR